MNLTEATEAPGKAHQAETDHHVATEVHIQAAATDTDQAAETNTQETDHLLITGHQETHISTDLNQGQVIIHKAPETDLCRETNTLKDQEDHIPETKTATENNAAAHQTAKAQEGHNHPTEIKQLYQG